MLVELRAFANAFRAAQQRGARALMVGLLVVGTFYAAILQGPAKERALESASSPELQLVHAPKAEEADAAKALSGAACSGHCASHMIGLPSTGPDLPQVKRLAISWPRASSTLPIASQQSPLDRPPRV